MNDRGEILGITKKKRESLLCIRREVVWVGIENERSLCCSDTTVGGGWMTNRLRVLAAAPDERFGERKI